MVATAEKSAVPATIVILHAAASLLGVSTSGTTTTAPATAIASAAVGATHLLALVGVVVATVPATHAIAIRIKCGPAHREGIRQ